MIPSEWLTTFADFAQDASLSRAARRLRLSQPAVHAQLARLAEHLGVPLYRRVGRGLALTREGVEVAAFARDARERGEELAARLRGEGPERRLVLATGAGALLHVLSPGLRSFLRSYEGRLEVLSADAVAAVSAVASGAAHVGVAALDADPEGLETRVLREAPQLLVLPSAHRLARKRKLRPAELRGERLVLPPAGRPQRAVLDAVLAGVATRVGATATGWEVVLRLVELGVGLGFVNGVVPLPRGLVARPLEGLSPARYVVLCRPKPRADTEALVRTLLRSVR